MSKVLIIFFTVALVLQTDLGCRPVHAFAMIEAPCCGPQCPLSSAGGARACCQCAGSGSVRHTAPISPRAAMALLVGASWLPAEARTPGACRCSAAQPPRAPENPLAVLCSRQI
jgi:hypothetical protein